MKRAAVNCIALSGALVFCGVMFCGAGHRSFGFRRPASAYASWGLA